MMEVSGLAKCKILILHSCTVNRKRCYIYNKNNLVILKMGL